MPLSPEVTIGKTKLITVTPTLTVAANYAAGDFVGTSATASTITGAARIDGGSGAITGIELIDGDVQSVAGELWLFDASVTPPVDSAAWSISDADALKLIRVVPFSTYYASALNSVSNSDNLYIQFACAADSKDLYCCFVTRGAPTYTSGKLSFRITIIQD